jgi:uncharacterized membrane protein YfcA
MSYAVLLFIAGVFVLAGFVKGVVGLGLPAISMGLLALVMPPADAASVLILPTVATNIWQMAAGPGLRPVAARLWPLMLGVICGTLAGAGWLTHGHFGTALLGGALALYALSGLASIRFTVSPAAEPWLGPIVGLITGLVAAATGVFAMPAVIYLQAIGIEKEDLVQALGLSFTVSSLALAVNLASVSALNLSLGPASIGALAVACLGMWLGQVLRLRLRPETFRLVFLIGLLALGSYLIARSVAIARGDWL